MVEVVGRLCEKREKLSRPKGGTIVTACYNWNFPEENPPYFSDGEPAVEKCIGIFNRNLTWLSHPFVPQPREQTQN